MRKNLFLFIIFIILIIVNFFVFNKRIGFKNKSIADKTIYLSEMNNKYFDILTEMIKNQNFPLSKKTKVINIKLDTTFLDNVINIPTLIFYFNEYSCMPCVDEMITVIKNAYKSKSLKIIILSFYNQKRDMYIFSRVLGQEIPIYNLTEKLPLPATKREMPFFFYLDKDYNVNNLLLVDKTMINIVKEYLSIFESKCINFEISSKPSKNN